MDRRRMQGGLIAGVSGLYSVYLSLSMDMASMWFMLILGVVVLIHGLTLLAGFESFLSRNNGRLMITYALLMLFNQVWMVAPDTGMVALALLMMGSGLVMAAEM